MATARQWCASVIQRAVRHWLGQRRAKRLREARERARHRAAATIQYHWKFYIAQKRRYESTYAKLKARLERYIKHYYYYCCSSIHRGMQLS